MFAVAFLGLLKIVITDYTYPMTFPAVSLVRFLKCKIRKILYFFSKHQSLFIFLDLLYTLVNILNSARYSLKCVNESTQSDYLNFTYHFHEKSSSKCQTRVLKPLRAILAYFIHWQDSFFVEIFHNFFQKNSWKIWRIEMHLKFFSTSI